MSPKTELQRGLAACRASFALIILFSFCINLLALAMPLYLLQVYDHVLSSHSVDTLVMLSLLVVAAMAVFGALEVLRREILSRISLWLDDRLQVPVLEGAFHAVLRDGGTSAQGWRDLGAIRNYLGSGAMTPLLDVPWTPLFIGSLFLVHATIGWIGTIGIAVLVLLAWLTEALTRTPLAEANAAQMKMQQRLDAMLRNAEAVRAMGMFDGVAKRLFAQDDRVKRAHAAINGRANVIVGASKFIRTLIQVAIMGVTAYLVIRNAVHPGAIFASSLLLGRALGPVEGAISSWKGFTAVRLAIQRLQKMLTAAPELTPWMELPKPEGRLEVARVVSFPPGAGEAVLKRVSFSLEPGETLGVIGPSGAGKSTLGRLIAGTWSPSGGHIRLDGADIDIWLASGGARHLGYLPQDVELFEGTVRDNIARLQEVDPDLVIAAARLVGIHDMIMRFPRGYDTEIGVGGAKLSGGQRQLIGLARAFFGEPRLVVLDEPNANLDRPGEQGLFTALTRAKAAGTTIVVIAHRLSLLNFTEKILLLREGACEAIGARAEILERLQVTEQVTRQAGPRPIRSGGGAVPVPRADSALPIAQTPIDAKTRTEERSR